MFFSRRETRKRYRQIKTHPSKAKIRRELYRRSRLEFLESRQLLAAEILGLMQIESADGVDTNFIMSSSQAIVSARMPTVPQTLAMENEESLPRMGQATL